MKKSIVLTIVFMLCWCISVFGQRGPIGTEDNKIVLVGEMSPSAVPFNFTQPTPVIFSLSNINSASNQIIQTGDSFTLKVDVGFIFALSLAGQPIVNSRTLLGNSFQAVQTSQTEITLRYIGQPAIFSAGSIVSLKVNVSIASVGASNLTFEVMPQGRNAVAYNTPKQFVRITATDFVLGTPPNPRPFGLQLHQTDPICLTGQGIPIIQGLQSFVPIPNAGTFLVFGKVQVTPNGTSLSANIRVLILIDGVIVSRSEPQTVNLSTGQSALVRGDALVPINAGQRVIQLTIETDQGGCFTEGQLIGVVF